MYTNDCIGECAEGCFGLSGDQTVGDRFIRLVEFAVSQQATVEFYIRTLWETPLSMAPFNVVIE